MNKPNLSKMVENAKYSLVKHSPEILTGLGIAGMITTTVLAVKATPKALDLIEQKREEEQRYDLTPVETVKAAWKPYIPAAVTGVASVACLIGASSVNIRRNAALTAAYQLSTTAFAEYKENVIEAIGEKKERGIRDKIAQKKIDKMNETPTQIIVTGAGDTLFLEPISMRPFKSDIETIRRIVNDLNYRMTIGMEEYISLSEFYDELGLKHTDVSDSLGWTLGVDGPIKVDFSAGIADDGRPCLVLDYYAAPRYDYRKLM